MANVMTVSNIESATNKRQKNRRSPVWDYFEVTKDDSEIVQCLLCDCRLRYISSSTSSMRGHIQKKHVELVPHVIYGLERQTTPDVNSAEDNELSLAQDQSFCGDDSSRSSTNKLFEMCVNDLIPISIVDGDGFREFVHELNTDYVIPSSVTLSAMIQSSYRKAQGKMKQHLESVDYLCLNIEQWIRANSNGYVCITVTAFFINVGWNVESIVLMTREIPERLGADDLIDVIDACLRQYAIPKRKVTGIIHNTLNTINTCSKFKWKTICCVGSCLSSAITKALELPAIKPILMACRKIVTAIDASSKLQNVISLDQDNIANLMATFALIRYLVDHKEYINNLMPKLPLASEGRVNGFKPVVWDTIFKLNHLCDLLKRTSNVMMGNEYVSASLVLPVINGLLTKPLLAQQSECSDSIIESFKMTIKEGLSDFIVGEDAVSENLHLLASSLDPRFKSLKFADSKLKQSVGNAIVRRLCEMQVNDVPADNGDGDTEERSSKRAKRSDDISFLVGNVAENEEVVGNLSAVGEFEAYVAMPTLTNGGNPLEWWRIYQKQFPQLSKLAKRYLCLPASTFPVGTNALESDDNAFLKKRCMLEKETTAPMIFLNRNFQSQFHMHFLSSDNYCKPSSIIIDDVPITKLGGSPTQLGGSPTPKLE